MLAAMLAVEYGLALLFAFVGELPLRGQPKMGLMMGIVVAFLGATFAILSRLSRSGPRAASGPGEGKITARDGPLAKPDLNRPTVQPAGDDTLDRYWKLGVFYWNPDDEALLVEKRFGIGYTLNFGRPASWVILAATIAIPIAMALFAVSTVHK